MVYPLRIRLHRTSSLGTCSLRDLDGSTSGLTILGAKRVSKPTTKVSVSVVILKKVRKYKHRFLKCFK